MRRSLAGDAGDHIHPGPPKLGQVPHPLLAHLGQLRLVAIWVLNGGHPRPFTQALDGVETLDSLPLQSGHVRRQIKDPQSEADWSSTSAWVSGVNRKVDVAKFAAQVSPSTMLLGKQGKSETVPVERC